MTTTRGLAPMPDGTGIAWTRLGGDRSTTPVVLLHGGPGLPDYLEDVAPMVADLAPVHRYDQRGTGASRWEGHHTFALHVADLAALLDQWGAEQAVLIGHSYGTSLALRFCLTHPDRVAAMLLMCGPMTDDARPGYRAERRRRMSPEQRDRLRVLEETPDRTEDQEVERLALSWFTDHADPERGWRWATRGARRRRPVNLAMNAAPGLNDSADLADSARLAELRASLPARTEMVGGARDPRPLSALASLADRLAISLTSIDDAGHEPWLEQPEAVRTHLRRFVRAAVAP